MDRFTYRTCGCCRCRCRHGCGGRFRFGFRFIRQIRQIRGLGRSGSFATTIVSVAFALSFTRRFCTFTRRSSAHLSLAVSFTFSRGTVAFAFRISLSFTRRFCTFARRSSAFALAKSLAFTLTNARVHWRVCPDQRNTQEEEGDDRKLHAACW